MIEKLSEEKVLRDPIHGYVKINDKIIWDVLACKEVQRLRRIKQLGSTSVVYHTGEHSRLAHSLGVYEIIRRMCNEVEDIKEALSEHEKIVVELAGLLHDIGHAPFSHSFENILERNHEEYTIQIILSDSEINTVLKKYDKKLPEEVASVITGTHKNEILCQMVSSQLDADRMDYLLRDSYFTGTAYGQFDLERILRTLRVKDNKLVVKESGMHTVEDYIMARYHMYWQVYYHPVSRSFDALLNQCFMRLKDLQKEKDISNDFEIFKPLLTQKILTNKQFQRLDDASCLYGIRLMSEYSDPILSDLATRILDRKLFQDTDVENIEKVEKFCQKNNYDPKYYIYRDSQKQNPYKPYSESDDKSIWVKCKDDTVKELASVSKIVKALVENEDTTDAKLFYPKK